MGGRAAALRGAVHLLRVEANAFQHIVRRSRYAGGCRRGMRTMQQFETAFRAVILAKGWDGSAAAGLDSGNGAILSQGDPPGHPSKQM